VPLLLPLLLPSLLLLLQLLLLSHHMLSPASAPLC
jgi:hypothetical protein